MARIDWNAPLETDEETPRRVTSAVRATPPGFDSLIYSIQIEGGAPGMLIDENGVGGWGVPRIRNVRPVRTADEALQRMERLVRKLADLPPPPPNHPDAARWSEAREIVALLPALPVDPDLIEARRLAGDEFNRDHGAAKGAPMRFAHRAREGLEDDSAYVRCVLLGVKRGRELAETA